MQQAPDGAQPRKGHIFRPQKALRQVLHLSMETKWHPTKARNIFPSDKEPYRQMPQRKEISSHRNINGKAPMK